MLVFRDRAFEEALGKRSQCDWCSPKKGVRTQTRTEEQLYRDMGVGGWPSARPGERPGGEAESLASGPQGPGGSRPCCRSPQAAAVVMAAEPMDGTGMDGVQPAGVRLQRC